jgi:outer membrane protein assembly factor BamB
VESTVLVLIDLDAPAPVRTKPAVRWNPLVMVALLLAVAEVIGGAAPPVRAGQVAQVTDPAGLPTWSSLLTEDALYTTYFVDETRSEIRAWPLRPGGPRWTARVSGYDLRLSRTGTTLVADGGGEGGLTVLDARTGRERWHVEAGAVTVVLGDRVAISAPGVDDEPGELRMADLAGGRTIWSRPGYVDLLYASGDHRYLIELEPWGVGATVYAAADGRVLLRGRDLGIDPKLWGVLQPEPFTAVAVVGDRLIVYGPDAVSAFRVADLAPLWRTPVKSPLAVSGCGGALCAGGADGLTVLDPETGAIRWSDPRWRTLDANGIVAGAEGRSARVDPATGRIRRDLGPGAVVGDLMLRSGADRIWVTDLADGSVLGTLPPVLPSSCSAAGAYLACSSAGRATTVWQITRAE